MGWIAANARKFPSSPAPVAGADVEVEVCAVEDRAIEKPNKTRERVRATPIIKNPPLRGRQARADRKRQGTVCRSAAETSYGTLLMLRSLLRHTRIPRAHG